MKAIYVQELKEKRKLKEKDGSSHRHCADRLSWDSNWRN